MGDIRYTRHARDKFKVLDRHGFEVTFSQIEETIFHPEKVIPQSRGKLIAQKRISARHVLRVVYRMEGETYVVITFYPGRRERYESQL